MADSFWSKILNALLDAFTKAAVKELKKPQAPVEIPVNTPEKPKVEDSTSVSEQPAFKITMDELLNNKYKLEDQSAEIQANLKILQEKVNKIRELWEKAMTVTSGLRTMEDHIRIYKSLADKKKKPFEDGVFDEAKVPKKSKHLYGQACDIFDPELLLTKWLKENNSQRLVDVGLWCEEGNTNWVHFQIVPPNSGNRWFLP